MNNLECVRTYPGSYRTRVSRSPAGPEGRPFGIESATVDGKAGDLYEQNPEAGVSHIPEV